METKIVGNLEWQEEVLDRKMSLEEAKEYAASLGNGWRLPTRKELDTLFDDTLASPASSIFSHEGIFWSSTRWAHNGYRPKECEPTGYWAFSFGPGFPLQLEPESKCYVRCVRNNTEV